MEKAYVTLVPKKSSGGGLYVPGKDRVVFRPPQKKSLLSLDGLDDGGLKNPRDSKSRHDYGGEDHSRVRRTYQDDSSDYGKVYDRGRKAAYEQDQYGEEYGRKRGRYDGSMRKPSRSSDWDDGNWEWNDTPRRDSYSNARKYLQPSPCPPMLVRASVDTLIVSPWDPISSSPVRVSPSGCSVKSSSLKHGPSSHKEDGNTGFDREHKYEISESMRLEMEYNSDRAWYDREEGNTMYDTTDSSSLFYGGDPSFKKKEAELAKRLVRRDGSKMTLSQSKKLSQLNADNAQWEDRRLLRSGAVRGTTLQTEFEDGEENKVILLVHGTDLKPPFLDDSVIFTKQSEPISQ